MKNEETNIQNDIQNYLNSRHILNTRINADMNTVGVPDLLCCYRGRYVAFEVKTLKGIASELQKEFIRQVVNNGGFAFKPKSLIDVVNALVFIDECIKNGTC